MKSKNPKIQILKKGIATLLLSIMMSAQMSVLSPIANVVLAAQTDYDTVQGVINNINNDNVLEIDTEDEILAVAKYVNNGNTTAGITFKLTNNISLTTTTIWNPIGTNTYPFKGIFDGQCYSVSGLKSDGEVEDVGFFGRLGEGAVVKNLEILDFDTTNSDITNFGGIAGYASGATITNCISGSKDQIDAITVSAECNGGIVGSMANTEITNCENRWKIEGRKYAGGIVGKILDNSGDIKISKSANYGSITKGTDACGGIVGYAWGNHTLEIEDSINSGSIGNGSSLGGIIGNANNGTTTITRCANFSSGKLLSGSSGSYIGGILGYSSSSDLVIQYCFNGAFIGSEERKWT